MSNGEFMKKSDIRPPITEEVGSPLVEAIEAARYTGAVPRAELTELLNSEDSQRIALYMPKKWLPYSEDGDYASAYTNAWWNTLSQPDQRADFVEGDIGDLHAGEPRPVVVKAAHLSPWLLERGLITQHDIQRINDETNSDVVRDSFRDIYSLGPLPTLSTTELSPERIAWLRTHTQEAMIRSASMVVEDFEDVDRLTHSRDTFDTQVALRAIARLGRKGVLYEADLQWVEQQLHHEAVGVRNRAVTTYRHLFNAGILPQEALEDAGVTTPKLSGALSENIKDELPQLKMMVEKMSTHPLLKEALYPVLITGGSRLKGYAQEGASDLDTAIFIKPDVRNTEALHSGLKAVFGGDVPAEFWLEETDQGLRIKDMEHGTSNEWSHLVYNAVWVGDDTDISLLRQQLTAAYDEDADLRQVALRRLEQDALQYRLMHKGYERHYAVQADDQPIQAGGRDLQSTFWDPGYRALATQLFAEKVRLPKLK